MTGLAAGFDSGLPVYEAEETPGGVCSSYYIRPGETKRLLKVPEDSEVYRFEIGGGHWIHCSDALTSLFIRSLTSVKSYVRRSSVYFRGKDLYVSYPLQNHLGSFGKDISIRALKEMASSPGGSTKTMADWIENNFGKTLADLFFNPFHRLYTAELWTRIAPQDAYKSPVDFSLVVDGAFEETPPIGYNASFIYTINGLNVLIQRMAERCEIHYGKRVVHVYPQKKEIYFSNGSSLRYETLFSTLPLNMMMKITGLEVEDEVDPYTSVLVLNIGAIRGPKCPDDHWLYIPDSLSGFYRLGFYSNVDTSFLPVSYRRSRKHVSIYVERAYPGGEKPSEEGIRVYCQKVLQELREWEFIDEVEVIDPTWVDVAYTWSLPESKWKQKALTILEKHNIHQIGRYGRWGSNKGIVDSIKDGFIASAALKAIKKK